MTKKAKQIIVMRSDLKNYKGEKVRTGKLIAQACHASLGSILNLAGPTYEGEIKINVENPAIREWLNADFTKICVKVDSEEELLEIYKKCIDGNINVKLICDIGNTEFDGVPTKTCLAIGPDYPANIDPITKHLKLL